MKKHFERLNWLTQENIGKAYSINLFGYHITLHIAYYKHKYWYK